MSSLQDSYKNTPECLVVSLAQVHDRSAFAELVLRHQSWIRNLLRRCCGDFALADDLAQQVFLIAWQKISQLQQPDKFGAWLKRLAITVWLQYLRKKDILKNAHDADDIIAASQDYASFSIDLDRALSALTDRERLCIVLSYNEGMTHDEIAQLSQLPLGTVKSHIRRGTNRLRQSLTAYRETPHLEQSP